MCWRRLSCDGVSELSGGGDSDSSKYDPVCTLYTCFEFSLVFAIGRYLSDLLEPLRFMNVSVCSKGFEDVQNVTQQEWAETAELAAASLAVTVYADSAASRASGRSTKEGGSAVTSPRTPRTPRPAGDALIGDAWKTADVHKQIWNALAYCLASTDSAYVTNPTGSRRLMPSQPMSYVETLQISVSQALSGHTPSINAIITIDEIEMYPRFKGGGAEIKRDDDNETDKVSEEMRLVTESLSA